MKLKGIVCIALLAAALGGCGTHMMEQPASSEPWVLPSQYDDAVRIKKMLSQADNAQRAEAQPVAVVQ